MTAGEQAPGQQTHLHHRRERTGADTGRRDWGGESDDRATGKAVEQAAAEQVADQQV